MKQLKDIKENILSVVEDGEILIIVPPVRSINDICMGPHILQALAEENGYPTNILYLNLLLASIIGVERYEKIDNAPLFWMIAERLFARSAHGLPPLGNNPGYCTDETLSISGSKKHVKMFYENEPFDLDENLRLEQICTFFIDEVVAVLTSLDYKVIGFSAQAGQINCSIALIKGIKVCCPNTITIIGGPGCEGRMAEGIDSLNNSIDFIFQGEGETAFLNFLKDYSKGELPSQRIIPGNPLNDLDTIPFPDYKIFSKQYVHFLGEEALKNLRVWYETSRGCWKGDNGKCTFCAVPGKYREKSIHKTLDDLMKIKDIFPGKIISVTDNIMPGSYHKDLLPILSKEKDFPPLAYPLRANIDWHDLVHLKNAKIYALLLGIETFSTHLLNLMKKGITARQNLLALRNALSLGIYVDWFLLWGFPGEKISDYEEVLRILPLISHLQPPRRLLPVLFTPFCYYFERPQEYKMTRLRPWAVYDMIFPGWTNIDKIAYYHTAEYPSEAHENPGLIRGIAKEIEAWKEAWKKSKLFMTFVAGCYIIYDSRRMNKKDKKHILDAAKVKEVMTCGLYNESETQRWAVEQKLGVIVDSWYVPLVTARPGLLSELEKGIQDEKY